VRGSYVRLLEPLLAGLRERIRPGATVARIEWGGPNAVVRLAGGDELRANAVICTGSVAVLHEGGLEFAPSLPPEKREAIGAFGIYDGLKTLLQFRWRFWPEEMDFLHSDTFLPQFWTPRNGRGGQAHVLTSFVSGTRADFLRGLGVDLSAPLGQRLLFAGEATDFDGYSRTAHGAIATGRRAAREVLAARSTA